jgi:hypothetical protein
MEIDYIFIIELNSIIKIFYIVYSLAKIKMLPKDILAEIFVYSISNSLKKLDEFEKKNLNNTRIIIENYIKKVIKKYIYPLSHSCSAAFQAIKLFDTGGRFHSFLKVKNVIIFTIKTIDLIPFLKEAPVKFLIKEVLRKYKNSKSFLIFDPIYLIKNFIYFDEIDIFKGNTKIDGNEFIKIKFSDRLKIKVIYDNFITFAIRIESKISRNKVIIDDLNKKRILWPILKYYNFLLTNEEKLLEYQILSAAADKIIEEFKVIGLEFLKNSSGQISVEKFIKEIFIGNIHR